MRFGLLGTLEVTDRSGAPVDVGGAQPRTVLALLLAAAGQLVAADRLVDVIWGDEPPDSAAGTVQSYISRLRRTLEPDRAPRDPPKLLLWEPPGYRLQVAEEDVDFRRFERLVARGRSELDAGSLDAGRRTLLEADSLWRGPALMEFLDHEFARGLAARLEERRMSALDDRIDAELRLGRHSDAIADLTELVGRHPLRETLRGHLALALYRAGRQSEALRAIDDARRVLREELGVEPGRALRDLEHRILEHDPSLEADPRSAAGTSAGTSAGTVADTAVGIANGATVTDVAAVTPHGTVTPGTAAERAPRPATATASGHHRLVGRETELDQLTGALDEATTSGARFALVEGEPGIGKTSLVEAVAAVAAERGAVVVWGRCHEGDAAPTLWPWIAALRSLVDAAPGAVPGADATGLDQLLAPTTTAPPTATRFELFDAVARVLGAAGHDAPVVVVLDDLQWADATSLELLTFLAGRLTDEPVYVLGTVRELDVGRNDQLVEALAAMTRRAGSRRIDLRGLDADETNQLLDRVTGVDVSTAVAAVIHDRAEVNPFYATELPRLLVEQESLDDAAAVVAANVPAGVRDVVRRRLARLPDTTVELLQVGAVIGRDVDLALLTLASDRSLDECLDELEPAIVQRLLVMAPDQPALLRFSHALVREVLVDGISSLRRARLHLRVADALVATHGQQDDTAEILAEHLWAAASVGAGQRAAEALEHAAEVAERRVALHTAEHLLSRAVQLRHSAGSSRDAQEAELLAVARLNAVTRARTGFVSSEATYRRGQELARALGRRDILHEMMWVDWGAADTACDFARGRPLAVYFRDMAETTDDPFERMLGKCVWAIQCWHEGRIDEARRYFDDAAAIASWQREAGHLQFEAEQRMFTSGFALHVHDLVGDIDDTIDERFDDLAQRQPDRFSVSMIWTQAVSGAVARGQWERAERYGRRGVEADPDVVFTFWGSGLQMSLGAALLNLGRYDEGWGYFSAGRARYEHVGTRTALGNYFSNAGIGLLANGLVDEAAAVIRDARREYETHGERWPLPLVLLAEAELDVARGAPDAAASLLAAAHDEATRQGSHGIARRIAARRADL
jgi:DNA-binding SARP family transcriptional activator